MTQHPHIHSSTFSTLQVMEAFTTISYLCFFSTFLLTHFPCIQSFIPSRVSHHVHVPKSFQSPVTSLHLSQERPQQKNLRKSTSKYSSRKGTPEIYEKENLRKEQPLVSTILINTLLSSLLLLGIDNEEAYAVTTTAISSEQDQQGVSLITDSSFGKAIRKSTIQGARIIDNLDEKWERFSDSLRDQNKCDENTGRRLYDNGFRKDGVTRIGNPVLGALCTPVALNGFNVEFGNRILEYGFNSAVDEVTSFASSSSSTASSSTKPSIVESRVKIQQMIDSVETLVKPSFDRSIAKVDEGRIEEIQRQKYNFAMYTNIKAINDVISSSTTGLSSSSPSSFSNMAKEFYVSWGKTLISNLAPNANRNDYTSPFPAMEDEFEDYDYNKNDLLDSLGILNVALKEMQKNGVIGYFEISIPYDDYGSVVTIAVDDDITLGSQLLLREQGVRMNGSYVEALVRSVMERANIKYSYDSFFIDPSTTKQNEYNPTQLLVSLSNLRVKD